MYRYLMSYSQCKLIVRDRLTGETKRHYVRTPEIAELLMDRIKAVNYKIRIPKASKCITYKIDEME